MSEFAVTAPGPSAGALLRQAREAAGLHIGALSVALKIPVKKIEALEADRVDQLPDAVFARALASSICRTLKVDAAPILAALPQGGRTVLKTDDGQLNASFQSTDSAPLHSVREWVSKPFVIVGLALLAGALFLLFLPEKKAALVSVAKETNAPPPIAAEGATANHQLTEAPSTLSKDSALPQPGASDSAAGQPTAMSGGTLGGALSGTVGGTAGSISIEKNAPALLHAAPATPAPQNSVASTGGLGKPSPEGVIAFEARGPTWVEVTDSSGVVQLRKTLAAGETIVAGGQAPLKVIIGRADATSVKVRGQDFVLSAVSRDNVARFEVK